MPGEARHILTPAATRLASAGIESSRTDARLLLGLAIGRDGPVLPHENVDHITAAQLADFAELIERRLTGEPVSRMRGWREFWSLRFAISPATLDPRPDSETLVESAVAFARQLRSGPATDPLRVLDLGTGSGCLLLSCLSELPGAIGLGVDINPDAITIARQNARSLGLQDRTTFVEGDFTGAIVATAMDDARHLGGFDIVLCNPPYIPSSEIDDLALDVADFDPRLALDGGDDGFDSWRGVLPIIATVMATDGRAFVEIGDGQADALDVVGLAAGLRPEGRACDLSGTIRTLIYRRNANN